MGLYGDPEAPNSSRQPNRPGLSQGLEKSREEPEVEGLHGSWSGGLFMLPVRLSFTEPHPQEILKFPGT